MISRPNPTAIPRTDTAPRPIGGSSSIDQFSRWRRWGSTAEAMFARPRAYTSREDQVGTRLLALAIWRRTAAAGPSSKRQSVRVGVPSSEREAALLIDSWRTV